MPRTPRLDFPGARHHVMNRTARRRVVFRDQDDLDRFLALLAELPGRFATRVHGWALMGNHFHAMLEPPEGRLSTVMAWLDGELARRTNAAHGWDGPLFRGRYRNRVVLDDSYWRHLLAYLHLNPVAAGRVARPEDTRWTSHRAYVGLDPAPPWLHREELLELYGSEGQLRDAVDDLAQGRARLPPELDEARLWQTTNTAGVAVERVPATVRSLKAEEALAQVAAMAQVSREELGAARRGRLGNPARTLAAWWLGRAAALDRAQIGALLGMTPGAVAGAAHRVRTAEGELAGWRDALLADWWEPMVAAAMVEQGEEGLGGRKEGRQA